MRIDVTNEDIRLGEISDGERDPIARAIRRHTGGNVHVCYHEVWVSGQPFDLPKAVVGWLKRLDRGEFVDPISFDLPLQNGQPQKEDHVADDVALELDIHTTTTEPHGHVMGYIRARKNGRWQHLVDGEGAIWDEPTAREIIRRVNMHDELMLCIRDLVHEGGKAKYAAVERAERLLKERKAVDRSEKDRVTGEMS